MAQTKQKTELTSQGEQLLHACVTAFNAIPNKTINLRGYRKTYELASAIDSYIDQHSKGRPYNNVSFADDIEREFHKYANLAYSIEKDEENKVWTLEIHSTSMSEIDDSEEGILGSYSYSECREIIEDIQTYEMMHYPHFFEEDN